MTHHTTKILAVLALCAFGSAPPHLALAQNELAQKVSPQATTVRIGFFPNVTHAPALVAYEEGYYTQEITGVKVDVKEFVSGTTLSEAFAAGALDIGLIGPGPAINAAAKELPIQMIAGVSQAGAVLIARQGSGIQSAKDLAGKRVAVPSLGNSQDIILRALLASENLKAQDNGGDVVISSVPPADVANAFANKQLDAALLPEPWGALLQAQGNEIVGDEKTLWRGGDYPAAVVIVNIKFAQANPEIVKEFLTAHMRAIKFINTSPELAEASVAKALLELANQKLDPQVLKTALLRTPITADLNMEALKAFGQLSVDAGYTRRLPNFEALVNLTPLQEVASAMATK